MDFHLSIKFVPDRNFTNVNITLEGRSEKLQMKERCDEILKQFPDLRTPCYESELSSLLSYNKAGSQHKNRRVTSYMHR